MVFIEVFMINSRYTYVLKIFFYESKKSYKTYYENFISNKHEMKYIKIRKNNYAIYQTNNVSENV